MLRETESLCPICLGRIPATLTESGGDVYMVKKCPAHGAFKTLVWQGADLWRAWDNLNDWQSDPTESGGALTSAERGCPLDCGLCPEHLRKACVVVVEVAQSCNLGCPVCFAESTQGDSLGEDLEVLDGVFRMVTRYEGAKPPPTLQLSGGEPTLRDDLPEIAALAAERGIEHIMVDTNGVRIAEDVDYLRRLKDSGAEMLYLQFDGVTGDVYRKIRGADLLKTKVKALSNCTKVGIGVVLVPTIIAGVNLHQAGALIEFAKQWIPTVRGIHFQPVTYTGRYPDSGGRVTIPELLSAIEEQSSGQLTLSNFIPVMLCCEAHCAFGNISLLTNKNRLQPITHFPTPERVAEIMDRKGEIAGSKRTRGELMTYWIPTEEAASLTGCGNGCSCQPIGGLAGMVRRGLAISGMAFQDIWNVDTARLKKCCVHVATPNSRLIPFCSYYLTSTTGKRLYRGSGTC